MNSQARAQMPVEQKVRLLEDIPGPQNEPGQGPPKDQKTSRLLVSGGKAEHLRQTGWEITGSFTDPASLDAKGYATEVKGKKYRRIAPDGIETFSDSEKGIRGQVEVDLDAEEVVIEPAKLEAMWKASKGRSNDLQGKFDASPPESAMRDFLQQQLEAEKSFREMLRPGDPEGAKDEGTEPFLKKLEELPTGPEGSGKTTETEGSVEPTKPGFLL
jgi:hypothetical protein